MAKRDKFWLIHDKQAGLIEISKDEYGNYQDALNAAGQIKRERLLALEREKLEAQMEAESTAEAEAMRVRSLSAGTIENLISRGQSDRLEQRMDAIEKTISNIWARLNANSTEDQERIRKEQQDLMHQMMKWQLWASNFKAEFESMRGEMENTQQQTKQNLNETLHHSATARGTAESFQKMLTLQNTVMTKLRLEKAEGIKDLMPKTPDVQAIPQPDELPEPPTGSQLAPEKLNMPLPVEITEDAPKIESQEQTKTGGEE